MAEELKRVQNRRKSIVMTIAGLGVFALLAIALFTQINANPHDHIAPTFSNKHVILLGSDPAIVTSLKEVTTNITRLNNLALLHSSDNDTLIMIDGGWIYSNYSLSQVAAAIKPFILSGVPIIVIGSSPDLIEEAIFGEDISFLSATSPSATFPSDGIHFNPENRSSESSSFMSTDDKEKIVLSSYEWGIQFLRA